MKVPPLLSDDVLGHNIPLYVAIILCIFAAQTIILILMGQSFLPRSGLRLWWGDIHSPENSKHMTDPYTATHIVHGLVGFYACLLCFSTLPLVAVIYYYLITLVTAALWEILENTPCVIERYRKTSASSQYSGDSVINSLCDSIAASGGFWLAWGTPWWVTLILVLSEEILLGLLIRDNLLLNIIQLISPFKCISDWQERGGKRPQNPPPTAAAIPVSQQDEEDTNQEEIQKL